MVAFRKMQGLGNDFVVFDAREGAIALDGGKARRIADRHFGIGCDTVVLIAPGSVGADAALRFYNADGGESESCGNASRCIARLLMDQSGHPQVTLATKGGLLTCSDAGNGLVTVDWGAPILDWAAIPLAAEVDTNQFDFDVDGRPVTGAAVSMGNPHCVLFVPDAEKAPVTELGPRIETNALFPKQVNVEFAQIIDATHIRMRVWERGVGVTLACGSGACATAVAAARRGLTGRKVAIILDGGTLQLEWRESDDHVLMTGPGVTSFVGEVDLEGL